MTRACPSCNAAGFSRLLSFDKIPLSGVFRRVASDAVPTLDLAFELCDTCGLLRQAVGSGARDYAEITRSTALQFPRYVYELISKLKTALKEGDFVLEIGANDGGFLDALRKSGFSRIAGVEPSQQLAATARVRGHAVICDYFGPDLVPRLLQEYGPAKAVICRHTLEHVPDPAGFVRALKQCLAPEGAIALVEVPDGSAIPELMNVYEFWDEHLWCFSPNNLVHLLRGAGLGVQETAVEPHLDTRNLLAWCTTPEVAGGMGSTAGDRECVALWRSLPLRWERFLAGFVPAVLAAPKPVYAIGASHSQTNLVNYAGIGDAIDYFIDDDAAKLGRWPPVSHGHAGIISTQQFEATARAGTIVKTGFGYDGWTERLCAHAGRHGLVILDPKSFIARYGKDQDAA